MRKLACVAFLGVSAVTVVIAVEGCSLETNGNAPPTDAGVDAATTDGSTSDRAVDIGAPDGGIEDAGIPRDASLPEEDASLPEDSAADGDNADAGTVDGSACNASNCGGACCGDKCVSRTCAGCGIGTLFCPFSVTVAGSNGQCLASCETCVPGGAALNVACVSCKTAPPMGTCAATTSDCPATAAAGACACPAGAAAACPGSTQVCVAGSSVQNGLCLTCGQAGTGGKACQEGPDCDQASANCGN